MKTALVLACDDKFIPFASVVARRVADLAREKFPIIIISDGVTDENKRLAQQFCPQISFIEAGNLLNEARFPTPAHFTRATYLRLYLDEILSDLDRITYIDSDMTPLIDIAPLLHMRPKASPVMATYSLGYDPDATYRQLPLSREAGYLQGGLQIFDLKAVRDEGIFKQAIEFAVANPEICELVDQDALNVILQGRWQVLDWRWNVMNLEARHAPRPFYVRHHGGMKKPWSADKLGAETYIINLWRKDLHESPWPDAYTPETKSAFMRRHVRPITRALEIPIKAAIRGDFDTMLHGEAEQRLIRRYLQRLPAILRKIEQAAREEKLAVAL